MANKFVDNNALLYIFTKIKNAFVQAESGKGLSANDFTDDAKAKLDGIETGAQVNVQSDWNATTGDGFIKNKPSIPANTSDLTNDSGFITTGDIPEGAAASTTSPKMDGTATVGVELAFARGDHVHPSDTSRVPTTRTVNGKALSSNITLSAGDVSAIPVSDKGAANGVASLDSDGKVPSSQLPSYVDDVVEGYYYNGKFYSDSAHANVLTGEGSKIYVDLDTNLSYRYGGTAYVQITSSDMVALTNQEIETIYANA